jgi:hypothetical protein
MEFNDYIKFITKSTIAETAIIKRVKAVIKMQPSAYINP